MYSEQLADVRNEQRESRPWRNEGEKEWIINSTDKSIITVA